MTEDEVEKYICNMALSGALDFIKTYEGENEKDSSGIIGHFGLGFYSSFMVADRVDLCTKSYTDAPAVFWSCGEDGSYEMHGDVTRERGTTVVMHLNEEGAEYLEERKLREVLEKYCAFMPVEIYLKDEEKEEEPAKEGEEEKKPSPINDTTPLWMRSPSECSESDYREFYSKVFHDFREPLFYMHINADYPLNFKGVLYFPKIRENFESLEGKIKLYYNQVFVADNIKEVIPEYLLMLRGVLDCPELPLNVSRSYLQNSGYVTKISAHIVKKVADKLNAMFNNEREAYEAMWKELRTFVEYGCISDRKFYDRVEKSLLYPLSDGTNVTLAEYLERAKEKHENVVYYATDEALQSQYIAMYRARGIDVAVMSSMVDDRFMQSVEQYKSGVKFKRVDADVDALKDESESADDEAMTELFTRLAGEGAKLTVKLQSLTDTTVPALLNISEESRRMEEMMRFYMPDAPKMPSEATLILNTANPIVAKLRGGEYGDKRDDVAGQVLSLAVLAQRTLSAEELQKFLASSYKLLETL
jgi:molecular chaperone HtpG